MTACILTDQIVWYHTLLRYNQAQLVQVVQRLSGELLLRLEGQRRVQVQIGQGQSLLRRRNVRMRLVFVRHAQAAWHQGHYSIWPLRRLLRTRAKQTNKQRRRNEDSQPVSKLSKIYLSAHCTQNQNPAQTASFIIVRVSLERGGEKETERRNKQINKNSGKHIFKTYLHINILFINIILLLLLNLIKKRQLFLFSSCNL